MLPVCMGVCVVCCLPKVFKKTVVNKQNQYTYTYRLFFREIHFSESSQKQ